MPPRAWSYIQSQGRSFDAMSFAETHVRREKETVQRRRDAKVLGWRLFHGRSTPAQVRMGAREASGSCADGRTKFIRLVLLFLRLGSFERQDRPTSTGSTLR